MFYELDNGILHAQICDFGAKITRLLVPDQKGEKADVVLGFATEHEWRTLEPSFNAVIGRFANRIGQAQFTLDGVTYRLPRNNGNNCLHGGLQGFHQKTWTVAERDEHHIVLTYHSPDGEEGFPGNMDVQVIYRLDGAALRIEYRATTDQPTVINLTNHAYFNLEGESSPSVLDHVLQIHADAYTPQDENGCPTGEIAPVEGTPLDFRTPTRIGDRILHPFFAHERGINNNFILNLKQPQTTSNDLKLSPAAVLSAAGRTMAVYTDQPGLQVYTGNYIEPNKGKSGAVYRPLCAVCLETQNFPDAPNQPSFPSAVLRPGETYTTYTVYQFNERI